MPPLPGRFIDQYIPVAFLVHAAESAAGKAAQDAEIGTEMEVLDSQSGTRLGALVKSGRGTEPDQFADAVQHEAEC